MHDIHLAPAVYACMKIMCNTLHIHHKNFVALAKKTGFTREDVKRSKVLNAAQKTQFLSKF